MAELEKLEDGGERIVERYDDRGKMWVKLDGDDRQRVEKTPINVHVCWGELAVTTSNGIETLIDGQNTRIEAETPYRLHGRATMYVIPDKRQRRAA